MKGVQGVMYGVVVLMLFGCRLAFHPMDLKQRHREQVLNRYTSESKSKLIPDTHYFDQVTDHFDFLNTATFKQRYFVNDEHWKPGGPVFFMLGQEGPSNPLDVNFGLQSMLAPRYHAMVVELEHRYYSAESCPVPNLETQNMKYLSTDQALEDFANFRRVFGEQSNTSDSDWVIWGCSYAGAMSTWLKLRYPQLFTAAIGGSSPLLAKLEYFEYDQVVAYSLNTASPECLARAQEGTAAVQKMVLDPNQVSTVESMFNTCEPIKDPVNFMNQIYNPIAFSVQYNEAPNFPRNELCSILTDSKVSAAQALANANRNPAVGGSSGCLELDMLHGSDGLLNTSTSVNYRKWFWQKCTQFGYFKTAPKENNILSSLVQLPYFLNACNETFGLPLSPDTTRTNMVYGGNSSVEAHRVLAPNGFEDPWHALSMHHILTPSESPIYYSGAGHCAPYLSAQSDDTPSVKEARRGVQAFLDFVLNYYSHA